MFSVKIQGKEFHNFNNFQLNLAFGRIASTFSFDAKFDPDNVDQKKLFRPFSLRKCEILADGELALTGVVLSHVFPDGPAEPVVSVSGYSVTGYLNDCSVPPTAWPLENSDLSLTQIAKKIIEPFGLSAVVKSEGNAPEQAEEDEETSESRTDQTAAAYLNNLCEQRNLLLSHDEQGRVIIARVAEKQKPIAHLEPRNGLEMTLSCNGQSMHDEITVIGQTEDEEENATETSIRNPYITDFDTRISAKNPFVSNYRPLVKTLSSGGGTNVGMAAKTSLAAELKSISLEISFDSWKLAGKMIMPGTTISVTNPRIFLDNKTDFFIESVNFTGSPSQQTSIITCVLPEVYTGGTPKNIFE